MRDTHTLFADAARLYDEPAHGLQTASRTAGWGGFDGGAEWMRNAMGVVRGTKPAGCARFARLGRGKYASACLAALIVLAVLWRMPALALPAAIVTFYAAEVRMLFVFPMALDGEKEPFLASHHLVSRTLPPGRAAARVMCIAVRMLFAGIAGGGFVRSWCLGCLAVVLWYEDARRAATPAP